MLPARALYRAGKPRQSPVFHFVFSPRLDGRDRGRPAARVFYRCRGARYSRCDVLLRLRADAGAGRRIAAFHDLYGRNQTTERLADYRRIPLKHRTQPPAIVQRSSSGNYGGPDFLPTTAQSLCRTPHLRLFWHVLRCQPVTARIKAGIKAGIKEKHRRP